MNWTLVIKKDGIEKYRILTPTGDQAKTRARQFRGQHRQPGGYDDERYGFTILDPSGREWMHARVVTGMRINWVWA